MSDDARRVILQRRARFVAASLAGIAIASCGKHTGTTSDAARDAGADVDASLADAGNHRPTACLCVCQPGDPLCSCL